jgi:ElaB/YqjD/DUF883 family membrane-anchored ribosome-binding protein
LEQNVEQLVDTTFGGAEKAKIQAADAFEEASRRLRGMSMTGKGDEVKALLNELDAKTGELKSQVEKKVEPVEDFIHEHPFMTVAIAVGAGFLIGSLLASRRD